MDAVPRSEALADVLRWLQMSIEGRHLSPAQRRVARYLVQHPEHAMFISAEELGERSGVSQPSVTRFAVALGFASYAEMRDELRAQVQSQASTGVTEGGDSVLRRTVNTDVSNLRQLASSPWAGERLEGVGGLLAASCPLLVVGYRVSRPLADLFGHFASLVHPDVRVVPPGSEGDDVIRVAARAGASCLLAFGLPRYPVELLASVRWARQCGIRVALVTDSPLCPVAHDVDDLLAAPVNSELTFDSAVAPLALTMGLLEVIAEALGNQTQSRLDEFDQQAVDRNLFIT